MAFHHLNQLFHLSTATATAAAVVLPSSYFFFTKLIDQFLYLVSSRAKGELNMSRRNGKGGSGGRKVDLKLNISPPVAHRRPEELPTRSATMSPTSSCVSSETDLRYSSSPEATSMMLVGCPRCLMYVMLAEDYPKCPKCKSTVLLDVLHQNSTNNTRKT